MTGMTATQCMAQMIGCKVTVTDSAVYASHGGVTMTVGYKFTGGDIVAAIDRAIIGLYRSEGRK